MTRVDRWVGRIVGRGTAHCLARPGVTFGVLLFFVAAALGGATRLRFDPGAEAYLAHTDAWRFERSVEAAFGTGDTVVFALRERGGTVFDVETLEAIAELDRILRARPDVARVVSIASARGVRRDTAGRVLAVGPLWDRSPSRAAAARLGEHIGRHPVYGKILVDPEHETTFLFVQLAPSLHAPAERRAFVEAARAELDRFASSHRTAHLAGAPVTEEAIATAVAHDAALFFGASLILCTLLLGLVFADPRLALVPLLSVGAAAVVVTGTLALLGMPLDVATATVPTLVLVVGLSHGVHFLTELRRQAALARSAEAALVATAELLAFPCALASVTSAVGLLALLTSELRPLRVFGVAVTAGLAVAYLTTFFVAPLLLRALGLPRLGAASYPAAPGLARTVRRLAESGRRRLIVPLALVGIGVGISVAALGRLEVDAEVVGYLDEHGRLRRDLSVVERTLGGVDGLSVVLETDTEGWFRTRAGLAALDRIARDLRALDDVNRAFGPADYLRVGRSVIEGNPDGSPTELPATEAEVAQLALLDPDTLGALLGPDGRLARVTLQLPALSSREIEDLADIAAQTAALALVDEPGVRVRVTGRPLLFASAIHRVLEEASRSFALAAFAVFLTLALGFASLTLAGLAMVPNILTIGLGFAVMVALGLEFDVHAAFVACVGVGVAVDDTIHLLTRFRRATESGVQESEAMEAAVREAGHPVLLTSLLLIVGFSVLWLSSFGPTVRVGVLATVVVTWAVVLDLGLLPPLLLALGGIRARARSEAGG